MKKIVILFVIILLAIGSFYINSNNNNEENNSEISKTQKLYEIKNFSLNGTSFYFGDEMDFLNTIYYKVITDYKEYSKYKDNYSEIIDMNSEDFENYFLVLTITENESTKNLGLESVEADETTLYIGLDKREQDENKGISIKIDKTLYREKIDVFKTIKNTDFMTNYGDIRKISESYSIEEAISDNCFVISSEQPASNVGLFDRFLENARKKQDDEIRIYSQIENNKFAIYDLKYSSINNMYYVCINGNYSQSNETCNYYEFNTMEEITYDENSIIKPLYESTRQFTFNNYNIPENTFSFSYFTEY